MWRFVFLLAFTCSLAAHPKKTVCLNMIVKNEKEVIRRCLDSVLPLIDTWAIVDTGSTDGTQEIIKEHLKDVPGELYERPWVNFGHNRQEALVFAKKKADYILFMDADDILTFTEDFKLPALEKDFYSILSCVADNETWFQRLVKADLEWFWDGVIHEDLFCKTSCTGEALVGAKYIYIHDGARAKDPDTALKDIELLKAEIEKNKENPRNFFYLARSYLVSNQLEKSLENFEIRAHMGGNAEEVFNSKLMMGMLQTSLLFDAKIVKESFFKAYLDRPHRAEPLYYLARLFWQKEDYEKGYELLQLALKLPSDVVDCMWIEKWIYDHGMLLLLASCSEHTGRYAEGIGICEKLLKRSDLPEAVKADVSTCYEALHRKNVAQVKEDVERVFEGSRE